MARLAFELVVLLVIAGLALYAARQFDRVRSVSRAAPIRSLQAPKGAAWRAIHAGTANECTEVLVVLGDPATGEVWDSRSCAMIDNHAADYDKLLYNAVADARNRAHLLNTLREE